MRGEDENEVYEGDEGDDRAKGVPARHELVLRAAEKLLRVAKRVLELRNLERREGERRGVILNIRRRALLLALALAAALLDLLSLLG